MSDEGSPLLVGFRVRPMTETDIPWIVAVERQSFSMAWTPEAFRHELLQAPYARCFTVIDGDGRLAGYASVWLLDRQLLINNLAVAPDRRRQGLGRALLGHLLKVARWEGCVEALLEVRPTNGAARHLYEGVGFRKLAVRRRYYTDGEDALVLRLPLSPRPEGPS